MSIANIRKKLLIEERKKLLEEPKEKKTKTYAKSECKPTFKGMFINVENVSKIGKKKVGGGTFPSNKTYILFYVNGIVSDDDMDSKTEIGIPYCKIVDKKPVIIDTKELESMKVLPIVVKVGDTIATRINKIELIDLKYGHLCNVYARIEPNEKLKKSEIILYCDGASSCQIPLKLKEYEKYFKEQEIKDNDVLISNDSSFGLLDQLSLITEKKYKFGIEEYKYSESNSKEIRMDVGLMSFKVTEPFITLTPTKDINYIIQQNEQKKYEDSITYNYNLRSIQDIVYSEMYPTIERMDDIETSLKMLGCLPVVVNIETITNFNYNHEKKDELKLKMENKKFEINIESENIFTGKNDFSLKFIKLNGIF